MPPLSVLLKARTNPLTTWKEASSTILKGLLLFKSIDLISILYWFQ